MNSTDDMKNKPEEFWKKELSPEEYEFLREKRTEVPFSGKYWNNHDRGVYQCAACGKELFSSDTKFDSNTGWPSFDSPVNKEHIELREDDSHGMIRTEVVCKNCGSHLGHVFDDLPYSASHGKAGGPAETTGKRYCINSSCLMFKPEKQK